MTQDLSKKVGKRTRYYHIYFSQDYHVKKTSKKKLEISRNALIIFLDFFVWKLNNVGVQLSKVMYKIARNK
jgi:hypothetical protein